MERMYWRCTDCGTHFDDLFLQECPICAAKVELVATTEADSEEQGE